jgi:hypothetical protein
MSRTDIFIYSSKIKIADMPLSSRIEIGSMPTIFTIP